MCKNCVLFVVRLLPVRLPQSICSVCLATWAVGLSDLLMSGYWPASVHFETVYEAGLFRPFLDLTLLAPGVSRQAFLGMLDQRTMTYGRVSRWYINTWFDMIVYLYKLIFLMLNCDCIFLSSGLLFVFLLTEW